MSKSIFRLDRALIILGALLRNVYYSNYANALIMQMGHEKCLEMMFHYNAQSEPILVTDGQT